MAWPEESAEKPELAQQAAPMEENRGKYSLQGDTQLIKNTDESINPARMDYM